MHILPPYILGATLNTGCVVWHNPMNKNELLYFVHAI